jgi:predicted transcriptional regulator
MTYKKLLRALIKKYGQEALADMLGVTQACVSYWLNGHRVPREKQILKLRYINENF